MFGKRLVEKSCGPKRAKVAEGFRQQRNGELHKCYLSADIIR
jgi:hypothetical protein